MKQAGIRSRSPLLVAWIPLLVFAAGASNGAVMTVGPHGTYPTLLQALDQVVNGADNQIRIESGFTYIEQLEIPSSFTAGTIALTGGWDSTFTIFNINPKDTIIEAFPGHRALEIRVGGGTVTLESLTVRNGSASEGGGLYISPTGDATVQIRHCRLEGHRAEAAGSANGGAAAMYLQGNQRLEMTDVRIRDNEVVSTAAAQARGGGMLLLAIDNSSFLLQDIELDLNRAESSTGALMGAGLYLSMSGSASGTLENSFLFDNGVTGSNGFGSGIVVYTSASASLEVRGLGMALNTSVGDPVPQLWISSYGSSTLWLHDSGFAQGDYTAVSVFAADNAEVHLTNLTVADHPTNGLYLNQSDTATLTLYNSVLFGNGPNLTTLGTVDADFNLVGVDPQFSNPTALDYRLRPGSPALDSGSNTPPGGLGTTDFDGNPRIENGTVDQGMYEGPALSIFSDGFESGNTEDWSSSQGE